MNPLAQTRPSPPASPGLTPLLQERARAEGGALGWERWMAAALYEPGLGYYARRIRQPGRGGDFSTSATLSTLLGVALAKWARSRAHELGLHGSGRLALVEIGAGGGQMAEAILRQLTWWQRRKFAYYIVEVSPPLREIQQQRLRRWGVQWFEQPAEALRAAGGKALVFSNELVDAFPCIVLRRHPEDAAARPARWQELALAPGKGGAWQTLWREADSAVLKRCEGAAYPTGAVPVAPGQVVEVHPAYREWLHGWVGELHRGALLTIDYGAEAAQLYHRRPDGSLRGYFQHIPLSGQQLFERVGHQDLTADVNFTDLRTWGEELGMATKTLCTQREFILQHAPPQKETSPADQVLLNPHGAGEAFLVLEQVRPPA